MEQHHLGIIKEAHDNPEKLSDWEYDFINSMMEKGEEYPPTEREIECIEAIGTKMEMC